MPDEYEILIPHLAMIGVASGAAGAQSRFGTVRGGCEKKKSRPIVIYLAENPSPQKQTTISYYPDL